NIFLLLTLTKKLKITLRSPVKKSRYFFHLEYG
ncbi:MAG: hypothetical protein ACI84F_000843, partial [Pseudoalteromonas tetraodonis]